MKILNLLIPKIGNRMVEEIESFTISWTTIIKNGIREEHVTRHKVFVKESDAKDFKQQLESCAGFIGCWIETKFIKN